MDEGGPVVVEVLVVDSTGVVVVVDVTTEVELTSGVVIAMDEEEVVVDDATVGWIGAEYPWLLPSPQQKM